MAHHASALKQQRQSLKRKARNRQSLSQLKTQVRKLRTAIEKGDSETAKKLLSFTDNRQDASLQAGAFNDFVQVSLLRSALLAAKFGGSPSIPWTARALSPPRRRKSG